MGAKFGNEFSHGFGNLSPADRTHSGSQFARQFVEEGPSGRGLAAQGLTNRIYANRMASEARRLTGQPPGLTG